MTTLPDAVEQIRQFQSGSLTNRVAALESNLIGRDKLACASMCNSEVIGLPLLNAALTIKQVARQVNVIVHAVAILILLPMILDPEEVVEYVSLGAGNTNKEFDLETNRRVAEFKFIRWQGGPETIPGQLHLNKVAERVNWGEARSTIG